MPEQSGPTMQNTEALNTADHSRHSSCREMLIEHLFVGEVMRHVWVPGGKRLEIFTSQVDDGGYDLVSENGSVVRHIQLKTSFEGSSDMQCNQQGGGLLSIQIAQIEEPDFSSDHGSDHDNVADGSV